MTLLIEKLVVAQGGACGVSLVAQGWASGGGQQLLPGNVHVAG